MITLAINQLQNKMEQMESEMVKLKAKVFELEIKLATNKLQVDCISTTNVGAYKSPHI